MVKKILLLLITSSLVQQFVQGQDSRITELEARIRNIENDGNKIAYCDTGFGNTTIVLVSGGTLGLETWNSFQERLSEKPYSHYN